jgi:protein O-GlcNAc transferase
MTYSRAKINRFSRDIVRIENLASDWRALSIAKSLCEEFPAEPGAHEALGKAALLQRDYALAAVAFEKGLDLAPGNIGLINSLSIALCELGDPNRSCDLLREAIKRQPNMPQLWHNLGHALAKTTGNAADGLAEFLRAVELAPEYVEARLDLATALARSKRFREAECHYRICLKAATGQRDAVIGLSACLALQARTPEIQSLFDSYAAKVGAEQDALFYNNYDETLPPHALFERHKSWGAKIMRHSKSRKLPRFFSVRKKPLKIGFLSPDLRRHPVAFFLRSLLEGNNTADTSLHLYSDSFAHDSVSDSLAARAASWQMVKKLDDDRLATHLRADNIDILIDLAGHTQGNRLRGFARRFAPYQATWLGYPNTTGLNSFDFRLVDSITDPSPTADALCTEPLQRIEGCFLCYWPPDDPNKPALRENNGSIVFGSANNFSKVGAKTIALWAQLLKTVPESKLRIKSHHLFDAIEARENVAAAFSVFGVDSGQIEFVGSSPNGYDFYSTIDIALDPLNYNGTTTTCEALWMGIPVVTMAGDRHSARVGASLLSAAGLPELVADTPEAYVTIAANTAKNRAFAPATLQAKIAKSTLLDAHLFGKRWLDAVKAGLAQAG